MHNKKNESPLSPDASDFFIRLTSLKIDPKEKLSPPKIVLSDTNGGRIGTLGNFSLIIGKAKSKKSFLLTLITAAAASNTQVCGIKGNFPNDKRRCIYIDTEQARYDVQAIQKRVQALSGFDTDLPVDVYPLRELNTVERLKSLEVILQHTPSVGFVVIDGIRDIITSINDEQEATKIADLLLRITAEYNVHISCVLHQNKNDNNARGHIGSELINKAETTIQVTRCHDNNEISEVEATYSRGKEPEPFAFIINDSHKPVLPEIVPDHFDQKALKSAKMKISPNVLELSELAKICTIAFDRSPDKPRHSLLLPNVQLAVFDVTGKEIGESKARYFISAFQAKELIERHGKERSPKAYYSMLPSTKQIAEDHELLN